MPDVFTKAKRSDVMSRISSRGNKDTELVLARLFRAQGITGWRRHMKVRVKKRSTSPRPSPQGGEGEFRTSRSVFRAFSVRPDFVFPKQRLAVFVDGCFWHACPLHTTQPKNNAAFWRKKFATNKARDRRVTRTLRKNGWRVLRIWEHELARKREARLATRLRRVLTPRD